MKKKVIIVASVVAVILAAIGVTSIYFIQPTENALLINKFSGNVSVASRAGINFKNPLTTSVEIFDITSMGYEVDQDGNSKDNIQVTFNISVEYKVIDPKQVYLKINRTSNNEVQWYITTYLSTSVDKVTNLYTYDHIKSNINSISLEITSELKTILPDDFGVSITKVVVDSVQAPETVESAIENKIAQQQEAEAAAYKVEQAENEAKAQKIKEDSISQQQQQLELCREAINANNANSPACYFGDGTYVNGSANVTTD